MWGKIKILKQNKTQNYIWNLSSGQSFELLTDWDQHYLAKANQQGIRKEGKSQLLK